MTTTTIGDLISDLVEIYERRYQDHELATVKAALIVEELLRAHERREAASATGAPRPVRSGSARKAA
jgi:hypothetical protein